MKKAILLTVLAPLLAWAARTAPWSREQAWTWCRAQPWIRGCNYMPASAANHLELWQEYGSEARFAEVERELSLAEKIGFNTMRVILSQWGFAAWYRDHDGFLRCFERTLAAMRRHGIRMIPVLGNDCSRPKELWELPELGPQKYDLGYHGGRRVTQHGSNPKAVGYTMLDDPELRPKFYAMCEELLTKYRDDDRILFWDLWNEPGNNNRDTKTVKDMEEIFRLAWKVDPVQPLAADLWSARGGNPEGCHAAEKRAGELSDIISYHCYAPAAEQKKTIDALKKRWGRPLVNTEWLARSVGDELLTSYPVFAQERVGCVCWGLVAGKYQTYEPYEPMWKDQFRFRDPNAAPTKWFHDLFRPSHHPYDPEEASALMHVNAQMDAERAGASLRAKIARTHRILGEGMWYGYRRTKFDFGGRTAWVVEPTREPLPGNPWTWTMQWSEAYVDRTGVPDLLRKGFHHVTLEAYDRRADDTGVAAFADFQKFLVEELGLAPKACLIGMSWGGFFSIRYAAAHPANVAKIYLDAPLLSLGCLGSADAARVGPWADSPPADGAWDRDPRMPVNLATPVARAGIPVLLLYGGADRICPPERNCELFVPRFKAAGGTIRTIRRDMFGHHPHGTDPDKTQVITDFFLKH